ncbi:F-box/kelch-repeat protein At3g06240 [Ricinus communis]|uniref:F-box/kelch-repeat protein At3g06240 n=1 Tax=Ricinus communis TaxID=3988 RepID=UPI00201A7869|nr:F-box/kelch-repeat protein At3g06240 [Ricinus communis]
MMMSVFSSLFKDKGKKEAAGRLSMSQDILLDILLRLPVKSIIRFRAVHSSWFSLTSSPEFTLKHLNHARARSLKHGIVEVRNIHFGNPCLSLCSLKKPVAEDADHEVIDIQNPFGKVNHKPYIRTEIIGSCNGLLLISVFRYNKGLIREFILWNPSTREHEKIRKDRLSDQPFTYIFGFGYDHFNDNYKLVEVSSSLASEETSVDVYNLKERCWERKDSQFPYKFLWHRPGTTLANGVPHWIVRRRVNNEKVVISFDLGEEKFKEVPLPASLNDPVFISNLHGYLCVGSLNSQKIFEWKVCVMREYGAEESWIKLNISFPETAPKMGLLCQFTPLEFTKKDEFIMSLDHKGIATYCPSKNTYKPVLLSGGPKGWSVATYVESLVSPKTYNKREDRTH